MGSHAYTVKSYDAATQTFALHNPWGMMHPGGLTWAQLQANCTWFTFANATSSPFTSSSIVASSPTIRSELPDTYFAPMNVEAEANFERDEDQGLDLTAQASAADQSYKLAERASATDYLLAMKQLCTDNNANCGSSRQALRSTRVVMDEALL